MLTRFSEAMRAPERRLSIRGTITLATGAARTLTAAEIIAYTVEEGTNDGLLPGAVLSANHCLELVNAAGEWDAQPLIGATAQLELGVQLPDGGWAWSPFGVFIVNEASAADGGASMRLTGGDSLGSELYMRYQDALTYPATLAEIWSQAVAQTRYTWQGTVPNGAAVIDIAPDWKEGSVRQAMAAAAMAAGCFVRVDRAGALELVPCEGAGETVEIVPETTLSLTHQSRTFGPVRCLRVTPAEPEGKSGGEDLHIESEAGVQPHSGNTLRIERNPLFVRGEAHLTALMRGTLAALDGMTLRAVDCRWRGDPLLRVGDRVRVTDRRGTAVETRVLKQKLRFSGGFSAEVRCDVPAERDSGVPRAITPEGGVNANLLTGTVDGGLLAAESVTARSIAAETITTAKLAAGSVTAEKLDAESVNARVLEAVQARVEALAALDGMTLRAVDCRWRGDPLLRVGDRVRVTDRRGTAVETRVLKQKLRFSGGFSAEVRCDVPAERDSGVPRAITPEGGVNANLLTGTVDGGLLAAESVTARSIAAETITTAKLAAGSVTAEKLDAESVNARVLEAVQARVEALAAGEITADRLYAALAQIARTEIGAAKIGSAQILEAAIGTAQIADAAITQAKIGSAAVGTAQIALGAITAALIENGAVGSLQIADGSITDAKIVDLTADKINAGTLAAERLLLKGAGGLFYEINAQAGGLSASQLTEAQYREAISGTALVARSVTADRIAARSLTANELAAHTITAAEIDVAQLFAAEATVNAINAMDIRGNEYLKLSVREAADRVHVGGRNYILSSRTLVREGLHGLVRREWRALVGEAAVGSATVG